MKDLIAKLQLDANCALGAIWLHIDAQAARIAELEAQIAALGTEPEWIDGRNDDPAEAAFWRFDARKKGCGRWKGMPQSERDAFKAEYRAVASTALQAPVREVPGNWIPISERLPELYQTVALLNDDRWMNTGNDDFNTNWHGAGWLAEFGQKYWSVIGETRSMTLDSVTHWAPLPAAPVQQEPKP